MLAESRLFNFIDSKEGFALSFLDGQKLVHDMAIIHDVKGEGFNFFRSAVLSSLPLINYLKPTENLGLFIDSETPYFRYKIEMNNAGYARTLLLPESFTDFPEKIDANVRLTKMFTTTAKPYTSVFQASSHTMEQIINNILKDSYQVNSKISVSKDSDQSFMLSRLPDSNVDKEHVEERISLQDYYKKAKPRIEELFKKATTEQDDIVNAISDLGFQFLTAKDIQFKCNCSRDRMVSGIASLTYNHTIDEVFDGKESLEAKCDYCKTEYLITKDEISALTKH